MWFNPTFEALPLDERPAYTRSSFLDMLRALISTAQPDYIRTQNTTAYVVDDHVDHIAGALFVAEADTDTHSNRTVIRRDEYYGYVITDMASNVGSHWADEKRHILQQYVQYDPEAHYWLDMSDRQYRRQVYEPGDLWVARTVDFSGGLLTDADGWNQPQYYTTIQTAVFNNQLMLLARGSGNTGLLVYPWDDTYKQFGPYISTGLFTDADGWNQPQYYTTIQTAVFNNQLMLLARGSARVGLLVYQWDAATKRFW